MAGAESGWRCGGLSRPVFGALIALLMSMAVISCGKTADQKATERPPLTGATVSPPISRSGSDYARDYIEVTEVVAKFEPSQFAFISLKLKNTGSRSVKNLKLVVYFYDAADKVIHENQQMLISEDELPLKPGYIKQIRSSPTHIARSIIFHEIPDEWERGRVSVEIQGLDFARE